MLLGVVCEPAPPRGITRKSEVCPRNRCDCSVSGKYRGWVEEMGWGRVRTRLAGRDVSLVDKPSPQQARTTHTARPGRLLSPGLSQGIDCILAFAVIISHQYLLPRPMSICPYTSYPPSHRVTPNTHSLPPSLPYTPFPTSTRSS